MMRLPSSRPSPGVALLVALLALGAVLAWWPTSTDRGLRARPASGQDAQAPGLTPPVRLEPGSAHVETRVLPTGDLRVTHWISSREPLYDVRLALPDLGEGSGAPGPRATRVLVAVDGITVPGPASVDTEPADFLFPGGSAVYVTYLLQDVLERSPSAEGRVLARFTSLSVSYRPRPQERTQVVTGAEVQTLACVPAGAADRDPLPCGRPRDPAAGTDGEWEVRLSGERLGDRVIAQMDLT